MMDGTAPLPELNRRTLQRRAYVQVRQLLIMVGSIALLLFALSVVAIIVQAQQTEVRSAEQMIVVSDAEPDAALVRYSLTRQRRNFTPQIRVVGVAPERLAEQLRQAGISDTHLDIAAPASLAQQLRTASASEPTTLIILAEPHDLVLVRKISRDLGLNATVGAPPDLSLRISPTLRAALAYWRYTLLGAS